MGRKKLHRTKEELLEQQRERGKRYYKKHVDRIKKERMQKYWLDKKVSKV